MILYGSFGAVPYALLLGMPSAMDSSLCRCLGNQNETSHFLAFIPLVAETDQKEIYAPTPRLVLSRAHPSRQLPGGRARLRDLSDALRLLHPQHLRTREAVQELGHRHLASQSWIDNKPLKSRAEASMSIFVHKTFLLEKTRGNGRFLKRTMVEQNRDSTPTK